MKQVNLTDKLSKATLRLMNQIKGNAYYQGMVGLQMHYKHIKRVKFRRLGHIRRQTYKDPQFSTADCFVVDITTKNGDRFYAKVRTLPSPLEGAFGSGAISRARKTHNTVLVVDEVSAYKHSLILSAKRDKLLIQEKAWLGDFSQTMLKHSVDSVESFDTYFSYVVGIETPIGCMDHVWQNRKTKGTICNEIFDS